MTNPLIECMVFIVGVMTGIINAFDSVNIGEYTVLDIFLSLIYLEITFWGIFSLLRTANEPVDMNSEERKEIRGN